MILKRTCVIITILAVLTMNTPSARATNNWQSWENYRWAGLLQFSKGNTEAAQKSFEKALTEAKRVQPGSLNEVVSTYDLAQVYDAQSQEERAEQYCQRALQLARTPGIRSHKALILVILSTLADLKSDRKKSAEASKIESEADALANSSPDAQTIGVASIEPDGTIKLQLRAVSPGLIGEGTDTISPNDPTYKETLMHLGPLKPGDQKFIPAWEK
jgi:tetratricopeptide (TPR) repeat protein